MDMKTATHRPIDNRALFEQCIKCTVCTAYCPVAKVNPLYPGPKQAGPDGARLRMKGAQFYDEALKLCTNCKRCETACPSGVKIGDLIAIARGRYEEKHYSPKLIRDFVLSHTDLMGSLSSPVAPLVNKVTSLPITKMLLDKSVGIDNHKSLPKYSHGTFRSWFKKQKKDQEKFARQIGYFHGCYVNYNHPQLGKDLVKVLNAMNIGVKLLEKEVCCGVPLIANGFHKKAQQNAEKNVHQLTDLVEKLSCDIISTSSTCSFTLKEEYPHVLDVDNAAIAERIHYVSRFLLKEFMSGNEPPLQRLNKHVVYHTPCHLERSGQAIFTIELLKMIPGLEVTVLESQCCGSAGTYSFKKENYPTSQAIGEPLFEAIQDSHAEIAVTDCETCKWQIEDNTRLNAVHPISLLADALRQ